MWICHKGSDQSNLNFFDTVAGVEDKVKFEK